MAEKKDSSGVTDFDKNVRATVGDIFKTTDGYFKGKPWISKTRRVIVILQRKDDGAVIVTKISKKRGKEAKIGRDYIPDLILSPTDHPSLTEDSIVGRRVWFGIQQINDQGELEYQAILPSNLEATGDRLTRRELRKVKKEVRNACKAHRKAYKKTVKQWKKHFPKQKE